ncbi:g5389 [Coccomyxa viridis]|uniref:G5389 protein n=1 Tax=Coccomyxa viridis TaxID=1274662 RepID=A0ABP1FV88_9CHLO
MRSTEFRYCGRIPSCFRVPHFLLRLKLKTSEVSTPCSARNPGLRGLPERGVGSCELQGVSSAFLAILQAQRVVRIKALGAQL